MAWTAPMTAVAGSIFTAAQFNTFIRDNLAETMPAKALNPSGYFVTGQTGQVVERMANAFLDTQNVNITSTSFDDPDNGDVGVTPDQRAEPGPQITVTTGIRALVGYRATLRNPSLTARIEMSYEISGETSREALKSRSLGYSVSNSVSGLNYRAGWVDLAEDLTPGINTFKLVYNVSSGTGNTADRRIWVMPL